MHRDGEEVHCTRTEFRLLCELAANPEQGAQPGAAARPGLGLRLLRRRAAGRRPHPAAADQGRARPGRCPATSSPSAAWATSWSPDVTDGAVAEAPPARADRLRHLLRGPVEVWERLGLRARVTGLFALGALLLSILMGGLSFFTASHFLVSDQVNASIKQSLAGTPTLEQGLAVPRADEFTLLASVNSTTGATTSVLFFGGHQYSTNTFSVSINDLPEGLRTLVRNGTPGDPDLRPQQRSPGRGRDPTAHGPRPLFRDLRPERPRPHPARAGPRPGRRRTGDDRARGADRPAGQRPLAAPPDRGLPGGGRDRPWRPRHAAAAPPPRTRTSPG